jgi:hypothetical protein
LPGTNTLAYLASLSATKETSFIRLTPVVVLLAAAQTLSFASPLLLVSPVQDIVAKLLKKLCEYHQPWET